MAIKFRGDFLLGEWVELFEEDDCRARFFSPVALGSEFVADFSGANQDAVGFSDFGIGEDVQKILVGKIFDRRTRVRMAQHAFRSKDDQRLAPMTQTLAAEQMEILRGIGGLRNLDVVLGGELDEALNTGAGMFRSLAFIAVREKHHDAREQVPFGFAGADELVDDSLRNVDEVAELSFPEAQRLGIVAAVAVFEAEDSSFGER